MTRPDRDDRTLVRCAAGAPAGLRLDQVVLRAAVTPVALLPRQSSLRTYLSDLAQGRR